MFRWSIPDDYALVFQFDDVRRRGVHMVFVGIALDVVWTADDVVTHVERLEPWRGLARARADQIVELPAGSARNVEPGDRLSLDTGN